MQAQCIISRKLTRYVQTRELLNICQIVSFNGEVLVHGKTHQYYELGLCRVWNISEAAHSMISSFLTLRRYHRLCV